MDSKQIAALISRSRKQTPAKVFIRGEFRPREFERCGFKAFGQGAFWVLLGDYSAVNAWMRRNRTKIKDKHVEITARNSALPLLDLRKVKARIEPGAVIREGARIGSGCVIMMGAVINIAAEVGTRTMVDMNAVLGARAVVGKDCHIGAGAVIAGVLEPPSEEPAVIRDNVLIGANAVVLEGVRVGKGSVVAAGAVVVRDVPAGVVVAGIPARVIKRVKDIREKEKISLVRILRRM
jgi:2,3,4,5-tetrahydropyridine-2,6-dicarboxylate N-acetyltransferase